MRKQIGSNNFPTLFFFLVLLLAIFSSNEAQPCKPSGKIRGKKSPTGHCKYREWCWLLQTRPDLHYLQMFTKTFQTYKGCHVHRQFPERWWWWRGHQNVITSTTDDSPVVALSSRWFNHRSRCLSNITIYCNGSSVDAMAVGECDSTTGCDAKHDYCPPCPNNVVVASKAVWKALQAPLYKWGELNVFWSDA